MPNSVAALAEYLAELILQEHRCHHQCGCHLLATHPDIHRVLQEKSHPKGDQEARAG